MAKPKRRDIKPEDLAGRHPEYQKWAGAWDDFRLLYRGGEEFLTAAGQQLVGRRVAMRGGTINQQRRFLWQLQGEPDAKYESRWGRAYYLPYFSAIIDYFRAWLFSQPPVFAPELEADADPADDSEDIPDYWADFYDDCTGDGTNFPDFVKDRFLDTLVCGRAGWLVSKADDLVGGSTDLDRDCPVLTAYKPEDILDWQHDSHGQLEWVLLRKVQHARAFPEPRKQTTTYIYADREEWEAWEETEGDDKEGATLARIGGEAHDFGVVPFVLLEVPHGLWIANKLAGWALDIFNGQNMLSFGKLMACYLQPYLKSHDGGAAAINRVYGEGIMLNLRCGQNGMSDEDFGFKGPDIAPLKFTADDLLALRDEGYRICHQMALAVDSKGTGATAIARSGVSKQEDRRSSEIILAGYGTYVRAAMRDTANLVAKAMGDDKTRFTCVGYDSFDVSSLDEELTTAGLMSSFDIPSPTFKKKLYTNIATGRVLGHLDEGTRRRITNEIDEAVDEQVQHAEEAKLQGPPGIDPPQVDENGDPIPPPDPTDPTEPHQVPVPADKPPVPKGPPVPPGKPGAKVPPQFAKG